MTVHTTILTGKAAQDALKAGEQVNQRLQEEITRRGGKTFEGVILLPDDRLTSALSAEEVDGD